MVTADRKNLFRCPEITLPPFPQQEFSDCREWLKAIDEWWKKATEADWRLCHRQLFKPRWVLKAFETAVPKPPLDLPPFPEQEFSTLKEWLMALGEWIEKADPHENLKDHYTGVRLEEAFEAAVPKPPPQLPPFPQREFSDEHEWVTARSRWVDEFEEQLWYVSHGRFRRFLDLEAYDAAVEAFEAAVPKPAQMIRRERERSKNGRCLRRLAG